MTTIECTYFSLMAHFHAFFSLITTRWRTLSHSQSTVMDILWSAKLLATSRYSSIFELWTLYSHKDILWSVKLLATSRYSGIFELWTLHSLVMYRMVEERSSSQAESGHCYSLDCDICKAVKFSLPTVWL